jgi:hypothetical protein
MTAEAQVIKSGQGTGATPPRLVVKIMCGVVLCLWDGEEEEEEEHEG